ncbi:MAG TPA: PIN domain-containing protein [Chloroflexota bacterium]|nr:PIN domain-containing protein [Chloroflexota bacterium]
MSVEFCDTNVLVYAYDTTAGAKREPARALLERLWLEGAGALSVQVLQELFVTLTRKIARPLEPLAARSIVADLATWQVVEPAAPDVLAAIDGADRWRVSFWDAMIVTTALHVGAAVMWSEDLTDGQTFDGVTVRDPFRT